MADVRLDFYDLDDDALPDVCMRCDAPAVARPVKTFMWLPYWARLIPFGVAFMKRRRVPIPLCERHKNHWTIRYLIGFGGLGAFLFLQFCGISLLVASADGGPHGPLEILGMTVLAVGGVVFLAWLVTMIVLGVTQINVFEITDDSIVLTNVSREFADAYREQTRRADVEDLARRQWARLAPGRAPDYDEPRYEPGPDRPDLPPDDKIQR